MKTIAFAAAVVAASIAVSAAATPAFARAEGTYRGAKVTLQKDGRYCFRQEVTGSLVPVTDCRSKDQWAEAGLTISRKSTVQLAQR